MDSQKKTSHQVAKLLFTCILMLSIQNAQAAIAFRAAASTGQASGGTITVTKPAGTVSGDVMLASVTVVSNSSTVVTPAGWTLLLSFNQTGTSTSRLYTFYKVAGAAEPGSYSWTVSGTNSGEVAGIASFSGVDTTTPIDVSAGALTASSRNQTAPSITTTVANDMLVTVHELASARTWTPPGGMTEMVDKASRSSSNNGVSMEMNYQLLVTVGATGTRTAIASGGADRGATNSIALRAALGLDHIEIDYPLPPFSTCLTTPVTVYACANAACTSFYTGGVNETLSPGGNVVVIPFGSSSGLGAVSQSSAGAATLSTVSAPGAANPTACKNTSTGAFNCNVTFAAAALTVTAPNLTAGNTVTGTVTGCKSQLPSGNNTINFYTTYGNPGSGTLKATVTGTGAPTAIGTTAATSTGVILSFTVSGTNSTASFSLTYPDVGLVNLNACMPNCTSPSVSGSDPFTAAPHHFTLSNITCGNGVTYTGCIVTGPLYANPGTAINALGAVFMKAGNPFSMTVTAYNSAGVVTPNFGKETTPEGVSLTPAANMPDLAGAVTSTLFGSFGAFGSGVPSGSAFGNAFVYDEVGIITLTAQLASASYLGSGLKEITTPITSNIGRFIPDHFTVTTDQNSNIVTRADFLPQTMTIVSVAAVVGATTLSVTATNGFNVGDTVRIPGAGAGGNTFIGTIAAVNAGALTITLNAGIGTALLGDGTEQVIDEWGSYMGESMNAQFTLAAIENLNGTITNNYQGAYAKLNPAAAGNPLGLGAVDGAGPTYNLLLDTSAPATGSFSIAGSTGSAVITAPLAVTRGGTAVGPYNSVQFGIAPTDLDLVKMGGGVPCCDYDLGVTSATPDHTSIMDPTVQNVTTVRYGRIKIANANGSELLSLPIPLTAQYWNGTYVTNTDDSLTTMLSSNILLSNYQKNLTAGATTVSPASVVFASGASTITLSAPGTGKNGSVDLNTNAPSYLPNPPTGGRATFGVYKGAKEFIYLRENY